MKISASVYSNKEKPLSALVAELDAFIVDYFHIDCNDEMHVFDDIKAVKKLSKTPIDLHIITEKPERYFSAIRDTKPELVTFQYENIKDRVEFPTDLGCKLGLAITSETPVDVFSEFESRFDFILFMTTTPGKSGGTFNKENFSKIRKFRQRFPAKRIHVDGGVNADISFVLRNMGVYSVVSGSYLVNSDVMGNALHNLRSNYYVPSGTHVRDFMLSFDEVPKIRENASLFEVLKSIDDFNLGFTNVVKEDNTLAGLISNADVRKGMLKKINDLGGIKADEIINRRPVCAKDEMTISEMLDMIKNTKANILYLPVVNKDNKLTGALTFTNLIKGE